MPSHLKMHVQGDGVLSDIFRALVTQFDPIQKSDVNIDTRPCLPNPIEPNWIAYRCIGRRRDLEFANSNIIAKSSFFY